MTIFNKVIAFFVAVSIAIVIPVSIPKAPQQSSTYKAPGGLVPTGTTK